MKFILIFSLFLLANNNYDEAYSKLWFISNEIYDDFFLIFEKEKFVEISALVFALMGNAKHKNEIVKLK